MNRRRGLALLIVINLAFIWGNSLLSGETSGEISGGLLAWLTEILGSLPFEEFLLRKLGHFSEFACLGLLHTLYWESCGQKGFHRFTMPLLCALLAACCDETIQSFVPNRNPSVIDVWIDTFGACVGISVITAIHYFGNFRRDRHCA